MKLNELTNATGSIKNSRERAMADMESKMKAAQKVATTKNGELSKLKRKRDTLNAELEENKKELNALEEEIIVLENDLKVMKLKAEELEKNVSL